MTEGTRPLSTQNQLHLRPLRLSHPTNPLMTTSERESQEEGEKSEDKRGKKK